MSLTDKMAPMMKPLLRDIGIFLALLFVAATITYFVWGGTPSNTTLQAYWMYDGMFDYLLMLPDRIDWLMPFKELESITGAAWDALV